MVSNPHKFCHKFCYCSIYYIVTGMNMNMTIKYYIIIIKKKNKKKKKKKGLS